MPDPLSPLGRGGGSSRSTATEVRQVALVPRSLPGGVVVLGYISPHTVFLTAKPQTLCAWPGPGLREASEEAGVGGDGRVS